MEPPFLFTPAKRPFEMLPSDQTNLQPLNGESKRRPKNPPLPPIIIPPGHVAFRLLCHVSKIGGVIGKSGSVVQLVRQETGAKIRVEEPVYGCDERVILIVASENPKRTISVNSGDVSGTGEEYRQEVSPAQDALFRVFERVLVMDSEVEGGSVMGEGFVSCRLLAEAGQVGSVMGKGGKMIEKIRKETGAKIRVLPSEQLPACALPTDEVVQIMGDVLAVKKALISVSRCLQDSPPVDKPQAMVKRPVGTVPHGTFPDALGEHLLHRGSLLPPTPGSSFDSFARSHPLPSPVERVSTFDQKKPHQEVAFRLLCSNDKVGGVIGKGGTIVRALQIETGASISVGGSVTGSEERVITVSALENPETRFSPAQNAVIRVFVRSVEAGLEKGLGMGSDKGTPVFCRLLVASNQVGCLMGKGGAIISEIRKVSGTGIRILGGDQVPKCASENDEVVQINGEFGNVQDALFRITSRLRDSIIPTKMLNGAGAGIYPQSTIPETASYGRVREHSSPELYPSLGLSHNLDRQATLAHSMDHLGLSHNIDCPSSPRLWPSQTFGIGNPRSGADMGRGLPTLRGGIELGSGSKSALVTNTTMEIVVPEHVIGSVYGERGSNLTRIRQISGAKVMVQDPRPGTSEGMVIISGTPEQTQAAQSLLQAFILSAR
ncbi:KH domain-containing protein HEN4-like [Tasmannia lanceolata]|uniref:KH domain-containing protein HEN4-like n=1 Tax=Tasmannia lanceolata TaxID=3420 RepID=UPI004063C4C2